MRKIIPSLALLIVAVTIFCSGLSNLAFADTVIWKGPTHTLTFGLNQDDISHIEFPEEIINVTLENSDYVDILVVEGYNNRAFRMRSLLPKMATRIFMTGKSGETYIAVLTSDIPYRAFIKVVDAREIDNIAKKVARGFDSNDLIRAMSQDKDIPGIIRETYVIPNWFKGAGVVFELTEVWQSARHTGLVVHVRNTVAKSNEVNLPAITIPKTGEWGTLRSAAMENMLLSPRGKPGDKGIMFLIFER